MKTTPIAMCFVVIIALLVQTVDAQQVTYTSPQTITYEELYRQIYNKAYKEGYTQGFKDGMRERL